MTNEELLNQYTEERECEYKDRRYLVRDNGAICRLPKEGCRLSKLDNVWSFGTKNKDNAYMIFTGNIRVHQVVCTAFHGPEPEPHMVVDHIDTNRCNNRPENLRWLTRLENALNNPATRKKIIYHCGSVEAFIADPSILRSKALSPDIDWMRTVTKEEAEKCRRNIERWAQEDSPKLATSSGKGIGDYIFSDEEMAESEKWMGGFSRSVNNPRLQQMVEIEDEKQMIDDEVFGLKDSLTPGAKQLNWKIPSYFPLCPSSNTPNPILDYQKNLKVGKVFCFNNIYESIVYKADVSEDGKTLAVITTNEHVKGIRGYVLCTITFKDSFFIHESQGSFFEEIGAEKYYTIALGREWTGGDVFDDYC